MLWVAAVIFTIVAVIIGIRKWKRVNNPLYAMEVKNRKIWAEKNIKPVYPDDTKDWVHDPAYSSVPGNIYYAEDEYSVINDD